MATQVTNNIKVSVGTDYQQLYSKPEMNYYLFAYKVRIENNSEFTIQLLRRHWFIFDASGQHREVEGEGVIGQQPLIAPGESYEYESACNLTTEFGRMHGTYLMTREMDGSQFVVNIPSFEMIVPYRLN